MRATYIKPNSITQQDAEVALATTREILQVVGITKDEYWDLYFEVGYWYALTTYGKDYYEDIKIRFNYWAWWLGVWVQNDADLLDKFGNALLEFDYEFQKYQLLNP